ncbi:MAG: S-layer homology domain-containing protein [Clostridia bacterium]|nr:S-layer homology domain-containing protein [Clostridia bacterium]
MKKRILSAVIVLVTCLALLPAHAASMNGAGGAGNSSCLRTLTYGRINSGKTRVCGACRGPIAEGEPCEHSYTDCFNESVHWGECFWCGDVTEPSPHEFGDVWLDWGEEDHDSCTAVHRCVVCWYEEVETVSTSSVVTHEATCGEEGRAVYTAVFENPAFGTVSEELDVHVRYPGQCPGRIFTDMPEAGDWAHDPIDWAVTEKVTSGMTKTTFGPSLKITRGQVVTFLWRAAGSPEPTAAKTEFTDLKKDGFYYKAVLWAVEKGIAKGTTKTAFDPDGNCTRGQIAAFLYRYAGSPAADKANTGFTDVKNGAFYEKAVAWAVEADVATGTSPTAFSPNAACTRAQTVTFLYRLVKNMNK